MRSFSVAIAALMTGIIVPGCGGSSAPSLTGGPLVIQTALETNLKQPAVPLSPGQSVTASFFETRCRYQQYTSEPAHGQYALLGCDNPFNPAHVDVTVAPILASGQACGLTAQATANIVVFTKTGQGDPGLGGPPTYFCSARIADPTVHEATGGFTFLDL